VKRWIFCFAAIILLGASTFRGTDIGKLIPVEAVWLMEQGGQVYLQTDTGDQGRGDSVQMALENMKAASPGVIFLETADYLIVKQGSEAILQQVYDILRPSCKLCAGASMPDMKKAAMYLAYHESPVTLREYQVEEKKLPIIREREGRIEWVGE
jgi:hypothetical protein